MKTKYAYGNLVSMLIAGEVDAMMHVCNDCGVMGSGIALEVKQRIPAAYFAYRHHEECYGGITVGSISHCELPYRVINLHAQHSYGNDGKRYLDYEALYVCLETARDRALKMGVSNIGVPYLMGSARAGGNWTIVFAMIQAVFETSPITITVVDNSR